MSNTSPTIAIVDDCFIIRSIARKLINQMNYPIVIEALDGLDLLTQLERSWILPDICLLDIEMPRMDGFETAIRLRRTYPVIRILAYSANPSPEYIRKICACGASDFLSKESEPFEWKETITRVALSLNSRQD